MHYPTIPRCFNKTQGRNIHAHTALPELNMPYALCRAAPLQCKQHATSTSALAVKGLRSSLQISRRNFPPKKTPTARPEPETTIPTHKMTGKAASERRIWGARDAWKVKWYLRCASTLQGFFLRSSAGALFYLLGAVCLV